MTVRSPPKGLDRLHRYRGPAGLRPRPMVAILSPMVLAVVAVVAVVAREAGLAIRLEDGLAAIPTLR